MKKYIIIFIILSQLFLWSHFVAFSFAAAPSNGTWVQVGNMATRRVVFSSTLLQNGKVLIAGGQSSTSEPLIPYAELYDPISKTWSITGNLNTLRINNSHMFPFMVTLKNGKGLIAGGSDANQNSLSSAELYDPNNGKWLYTGNLNTPRRDTSMILLNDGRALIAAGTSGQDSLTSLSTAELYNPSTGTWAYTANNLAIPRDGPTMVKLLDGRILLAGGNQADYSCTHQAEIFDPATNTWSSGGDMPFGGVGITMTLLNDGKVFVTRGDCGSYTATSAIYNPTTNNWTPTTNVPVTPIVANFLLNNGNVLLRSGSQDVGLNPGTISPVDEVYNPMTNSWDVKDLAITDNEFASYTQLLNGDVLSAGGWRCNSNTPSCTLNMSELFTSNGISVPLLKQTDPQWGSDIYDGADKWSPGYSTIGDWGCALTSDTMILQYYGYYKLPDGTPLNPDTLNTWLRNQPDGYNDGVTSGYVNPWAIARLSKLATGINNITSFDALEYKHESGANITQLTNDLNNSQPDMLEEKIPNKGSHFIVATAIDGNTFDINDPYNDYTDLSQKYNNTFVSLSRYIPSHTDLSYITFVVDPTVNVTIKTATGSAIGDSFIQQPYTDFLHPSAPKGKPLRFVDVQKPINETYQITVSGENTQSYLLHVYLYDQEGNVTTKTYQGAIGKNSSDTFDLDFNKQNSNNSTIIKIVTFKSFIDDVHENIALQQVNKTIGNALIALINAANDSAKRKQKTPELVQLKALEITINALRGKGISESAYQILIYDDQYLQNHL